MLKQNPERASELLTAIGMLPGVRSVEVSIVTGSVLVHHDPLRVSSEQVLAALAANGVVAEGGRPAPAPERSPLPRTIARTVFSAVLQHALEQGIARLLPLLL